ncbi:MAG: DUF1214 domain-containing protein [Sphingomonadales bacterium]|nr:DUF1214 domain-containing protein [Sphingomonadales bacterium]
MALGDSPVDHELIGAWDAFCDRLKDAGRLVFKDLNPATPLQRADGFRYLTQNLSQAFDLALETKNPQYPAFHVFCSPTRKLGSDNADCIYIQAWIDGASVYRITGKRSTARMWNVTVQGPRASNAYGTEARTLHEPFGDTPEANLFGHELKTNWDGTFELYIGGERQGQNWLPTTPGSRKLFLRQYFDSWDEEAADYRIERVGMASPRPVPDPAEMIAAMRWAGDFAYEAVEYWPEWVWESGDQIDPEALNRFAGKNLTPTKHWSADTEAMDLKRGRLITMMRWAFENDEALVLEFDAYDGFWMITSESLFGNSMDYLYRPVSYTPSRTRVDPDGRIRFVLSARDPGYANWIDNQAYTSGIINFRNVHSRLIPDLRTKVVPFADLAQHMHAESPRVTAEERVAEMWKRFDAIRRRYRI